MLVNVQEWGCFSNFLKADNVQGGVLVKNPVSTPGPPPLSKILDPRLHPMWLSFWNLDLVLDSRYTRRYRSTTFTFSFTRPILFPRGRISLVMGHCNSCLGKV